MARCAFRPILAPLFVGACAAAAVPSTRTTLDAAQGARIVDDVANVREPVDAAAVDDGRSDAAVTAEPVEVPAHAVEDRSEPETSAPSFTRTLDRAWVEARGAPRMPARFDAARSRAAVRRDNRGWSLDQRQELLTYLRGHAVDRDAVFTEADARVLAQLQAGSGAAADGVLGDETMAVLLALGFRFSDRKPPPWEVKLEFYPGEIEDVDAWKREIEEKVTQKGGGFHDVEAPAGEGTIYVRVDRSIVASYRARGGPPVRVDDDREHVAIPTTPGVYRLGPGHLHVSSRWYYSQIPWGAELRKTEGGYQYRWAGRTTWWWATLHPAGALKEPIRTNDLADLPEVTRDGVTYLIWNKNDFGPMAWNLVPSDQYVHTTPHSEAQSAEGAPTNLGFSHGCIHIDPRERDEMVKRGYLGKDIAFVVRRWDEHVLPDEIRRAMLDPALIASSRAAAGVCRLETGASAACSRESSP